MLLRRCLLPVSTRRFACQIYHASLFSVSSMKLAGGPSVCHSLALVRIARQLSHQAPLTRATEQASQRISCRSFGTHVFWNFQDLRATQHHGRSHNFRRVWAARWRDNDRVRCTWPFAHVAPSHVRGFSPCSRDAISRPAWAVDMWILCSDWHRKARACGVREADMIHRKWPSTPIADGLSVVCH